MRPLLACLALLISCAAMAAATSLDFVKELRLRGDLGDALNVANAELLHATGADAVAWHLELAKIHDRIGLHNSTRPVAAALQHVELAAAAAADLDPLARAQVDLAYAEFYYRAEMAEREFVAASRHATTALDAFVELEDFHGQADAVHRRGLIKLQQRELDSAETLFVESLRLDRIAGERRLLRADFERHVGFVYALRGEYQTALPYFQRSLEHRVAAGATDASMFAAISLASALAELDRDADAMPHLAFASQIAEAMNSPLGRSRVQAVIDKIAAPEQPDSP